MLPLLRALWDIALWRRHPGDLPSSPALVALLATAYLLVGWAQAWQLAGPDGALQRAIADLLLTLATFWLLLAIVGRAGRFLQTISAVLGVGTLLSLPMMLVMLLREPATANYLLAVLVWVGSLALIAWYLVALGHILRTALESGLLLGMALAVTYAFGSTALLNRLLPTG